MDDGAKLARLEDRERTAKLISAELNRQRDIDQSLAITVGLLRKLTGCEAIGIRLCEDGDYPYAVQEGFAEAFIAEENSLLSLDERGGSVVTKDGRNHVFECLCGQVARKRWGADKPRGTEDGGFWCNSADQFLAAVEQAGENIPMRNRCHASGYESIALIPIDAPDGRLGLLQVNDPRPGRFDPQTIGFLEMIGQVIGTAVERAALREDLKDATRRLRYLSYHDELTGLYNRPFFEEELRRLDVDRQLPLTVIISDVNDLRNTNVASGYQEGDRLLIQIAEVLKDSFRSEDIVARWGGDEFAAILPGCSPEVRDRVCQRIQDNCRGSELDDTHPCLAIGAATKTAPDQDVFEILKQADTLMHAAKAATRGVDVE